MSELKPCPACGGHCSIQEEYPNEWRVFCIDCEWPVFSTRDAAVLAHNALPRDERWVPVDRYGPYPDGVLDIWTNLGRCFEGCRWLEHDDHAGLIFDGLRDDDQGDFLEESLAGDEWPTHYRMHTPPRGPEEA